MPSQCTAAAAECLSCLPRLPPAALQVRQLLFDLESAYNEFYANLPRS